MLTEYIQAAMRGRTFEVRPDGAFCVEIPSFWGAYAHAKRLETCGTPLHEAAEGWIVLGLHFGDLLPVVRQVLGLAIPGL
jgi:predicted RNase H-like HicB family nuclease